MTVTKTWGFALKQAHYPIEKHRAWVRERRKPESSLFAQRAFQKPSGRPDALLIYGGGAAPLLSHNRTPPGPERGWSPFVSPSVEEKEIKSISKRMKAPCMKGVCPPGRLPLVEIDSSGSSETKTGFPSARGAGGGCSRAAGQMCPLSRTAVISCLCWPRTGASAETTGAPSVGSRGLVAPPGGGVTEKSQLRDRAAPLGAGVQ